MDRPPPRRFAHVPVMADEVVEVLTAVPAVAGALVVDGTVGGGGHASRLLAARPDLTLLGIDRDPGAVAAARSALAPFGDRAAVVRGRFADLDAVVGGRTDGPVVGVLLDLAHLRVTADHLGLDGVETVAELARVKAVVAQRASRAVVLNAEDEHCVAMAADLGEGVEVIYFSLDAEHPVLLRHLQRGRRGVYLQDTAVVLADGKRHQQLLDVHAMPVSLGGCSRPNGVSRHLQYRRQRQACVAMIHQGVGAPSQADSGFGDPSSLVVIASPRQQSRPKRAPRNRCLQRVACEALTLRAQFVGLGISVEREASAAQQRGSFGGVGVEFEASTHAGSRGLAVDDEVRVAPQARHTRTDRAPTRRRRQP